MGLPYRDASYTARMKTRDVAKQAIMEQIARVALQRFRNHGFDQTRVDDIASDMGMSSRTFFRYYPSKDDVLLTPILAFRQLFLEVFAAQIATEDIWSALHHSLETTTRDCDTTNPDVQAVIRSTPAMLARQLEVFERLQVEATDLYLLQHPDGSGLGWNTVNAVIRSAFACMQVLRSTAPDHGAGALAALMADMRPRILGSAP